MRSKRRPAREAVKILIAEDSPTQAEQLRQLLEENDYKVTVAENGKKALAAARTQKPDLVISDIVMPEMDGYTLCKEINLRKELGHVPVILLTSLSTPQDVLMGLQCGADSFIRKPYDEQYILSRIEYMITNKGLRKSEKTQMVLEIYLGGQKHSITSEKQQILDMLIATSEETVLLNEDLKTREKQLTRSYQTLNALYHISEGLNQGTSEKEIAEKSLERAMELPDVHAGWFLIREGEADFRVAAAQGLPPVLNKPGALDGDCVCRHKLLAGELSHATNILECERLKNTAGGTNGLRYHTSVPIWIGNQVLGIINLVGREKGILSEDDLKVLHGVGNQVGVALERARLVEHLEKMVEERTVALRAEIAVRKKAEEKAQSNLERIRALHEIDLAITSTLDLRTILDVLLEKIELFLTYPTASTIRLLNKESGVLEPVTCRNLNEVVWKAKEGESGRGPANAVFQNKALLMVGNIQTDARIRDREFFQRYGLVSYLGVPLIAKREVLGVLGFYTKQEHEFGAEEIEFLNTLAGQAAIAIHNAQLYEEVGRSKSELELTNAYLKKSLRQLSGLYTALGPLAPSVTISEMMDGIIERLTQATGADAALIRLHDKDKGSLYWASQRGFPDYYLKAVESPPRGSSLEQIFNSGEPIIVSDIASDLRLKGTVQLQVGLRSCAMLPLKVYDEVRGIVHLASFQLGYFDEEQRDHLMTIARQLGIALENKELFDNLKASRDELERANKVKDEFLSVMSHELRTPLSVVMGYTGLVKDGHLGAVNEQQRQALQKVLGRASYQLDMINEIMQTTQLEAHAIRANNESLDLRDLLDQLRSDYDVRADKKTVRLIWHYPAAAIPVITDGSKLRQILQNLINNALKFTEKGTVSVSAGIRDRGLGVGNLELATHSSPLSQTPDSQSPIPNSRFIEFRVTDTGVGISKDKYETIFEKFHQVDSSETRLYGGVGLGLYIVKNFTELLGGTIDVESEEGKGSTFTVTLPARSAAPSGAYRLRG